MNYNINLLKNLSNQKFLTQFENIICAGNIVEIYYSFFDGIKKKIEKSEGIIIKTNNKNLHKSFTIQFSIQDVTIEQIFFIYSPNIINIIKKKSIKIKRAKLFYLKKLYTK